MHAEGHCQGKFFYQCPFLSEAKNIKVPPGGECSLREAEAEAERTRQQRRVGRRHLLEAPGARVQQEQRGQQHARGQQRRRAQEGGVQQRACVRMPALAAQHGPAVQLVQRLHSQQERSWLAYCAGAGLRPTLTS